MKDPTLARILNEDALASFPADVQNALWQEIQPHLQTSPEVEATSTAPSLSTEHTRLTKMRNLGSTVAVATFLLACLVGVIGAQNIEPSVAITEAPVPLSAWGTPVDAHFISLSQTELSIPVGPTLHADQILDLCGAQALKAGTFSVFGLDMVDFSVPGSFDLVIILQDAQGFLLEEQPITVHVVAE